MPAGCLQPRLPTKKLLSLTQGHPQRAGVAHSHPQDAGHRRPLLTPSVAMCLTTTKQKPVFAQRDDKTLDKALRLPPEALPALYRHQELDHRAPKATGECNYPCPADGEDDLAARAAQEPDLLAPSSACSPRQRSPHQTQRLFPLLVPLAAVSRTAESSQPAGFMGGGLLASSAVAPASPWHLVRAAQFPEILIIIFTCCTHLTGTHLKLLSGKRYHLEPAPGHSPAQEMRNKGFSFFGGCQHT